MARVVLFANTSWYLFNFRLPLAVRLRDEGFEVIFICPEDEYSRKLEEQNFRCEYVTVGRIGIDIFREISLILKLSRIFFRTDPDIIHNFTLKSAIYGSVAARIAGGAAVVNAIAGLGFVFSSSTMKARLLRWPLRLGMKFSFCLANSTQILQNPDDQAALINMGIVDGTRTRLIRGSGVDTTRFSPSLAKRSIVDAPVRVLFAGRILWSKGIEAFVEAARTLKDSAPTVRFRIAGAPDPGNPESVSQRQLDLWAAEGVVEMVGHVDDMVLELARTDIFVLPTYYGEGVPRSLIEAAACAVPLIATDVPGCREVVIHEVTGLTIPPRNPVALASAVLRYSNDRQLSRRLGLAARARAIAEFDEKIVLDRTIAIYRELHP